MSKEKKQNRIELLVENIAVEKQILVEYCDELATCRDTGNKKGQKAAEKKLEPQVKKYNNLISEYNKLTGEKVKGASKNLAEEILAGSNNYGVATIGAPAVTKVRTFNADVSVLNEKELKAYLAKSDKALDNVRVKLETTTEQKNQATGYNKAILILNCLTYQRYIIERIAENLHVCCKILDNKRVKNFKKALTAEIANYNKLVNEYEALTRSTLTHASETMADDIIAGKAFTPIPAISYTANDGTTRNSDAELAAVAVAAAAAADKATQSKKAAKKNKEIVKRTALDKKVAEQANKDVTVVAKASDFAISMLESRMDMTTYKFGKSNSDMKEKKKEIQKAIKKAQKDAEAALKCEEQDNARYYAVITNDPATMNTKKRKPNRAKIASIRTQMMTLLNQRDELNSKLLAIYNGTELNLDGTSVNQKWREIKSNAAEKSVKKNQKLARKVAKLPASSGEKNKLYNLMNSNADAASTLSLSKFRLKKKDFNNKTEKKALKADVKRMKKLIKSNDKDINWVMKRIKKRA